MPQMPIILYRIVNISRPREAFCRVAYLKAFLKRNPDETLLIHAPKISNLPLPSEDPRVPGSHV